MKKRKVFLVLVVAPILMSAMQDAGVHARRDGGLQNVMFERKGDIEEYTALLNGEKIRATRFPTGAITCTRKDATLETPFEPNYFWTLKYIYERNQPSVRGN